LLAGDRPRGNVLVSCETGLSCLFRLGVQSGVYAEMGAVKRRNLIEGDTLPVSRLIELAGEFGLWAQRERLARQGLQTRPSTAAVGEARSRSPEAALWRWARISYGCRKSCSLNKLW
jgi:hypothetical protein